MSTQTPTVTPTPLPPPPGKIYFFWDSKIIRDLNTNPVHSLYLATPGEGLGDWNIQPLVEEIIGHPQITLSPGKTKFAFTALEDKNGDGSVSDEGYDRGFDAPNIFTYILTNSEFVRLTSEYFSGYTGWLSDNELAVGFRAINTNDLTWRQLINEEVLPDDMLGISLSPDGNFIAVNQTSGQISLIKIESGEVVVVTNEMGGANEIGLSDVKMVWSSDSKWLALNQSSTNHFIVVNIDSQETIPIPISGPPLEMTIYPLPRHKLAWSPDNQYLAVVQPKPDGSVLLLLNSLDFTPQEMISTPGEIHNLFWSPNGSQLAMTISKGEKDASLHVLEITSGDFRELWQSAESTRFYIVAWSPDSEWLLFFNGTGWSPREDEAGIYVIHKNGGVPYLVSNTSGSRDPIAFYWLPEMDTP
ncbi:MAG: PD40 domain-containing protein [Anaerolineae bacterium]|nr:PD40 domain-containing protein [Anaerolineae bacterium]